MWLEEIREAHVEEKVVLTKKGVVKRLESKSPKQRK
jgi:hypothetical protein